MKWAVNNLWGGTNWWGLQSGDSAALACTQAQDRVLSQFAEAGTFYDLICVLAEHHGDFWDVVADVLVGFDLDTGVGAQLDKIGTILKLPRQGFDDAFYAKLLAIKGKHVLRSTGTGENILEICRLFIGDGVVDPIVLTNSPPYSFLLSVPSVDETNMDILIPFIRDALIASVLGLVIIILAGGAVWDSQSVAVTGGGIWGSQSVVVGGATNWSKMIEI